MDVAILGIRLALAFVFTLAALTKLADPPGTRAAAAGFGLPERLAPAVAISLPIGELLAAGLLVFGATGWFGALLALALLLAFTGAIVWNLNRGNTPDCHCFGQIHSEPIGLSTLIRNTILAAAAIFILAGGTANHDPAAFDQLGQISATHWIEGITAAAVIAAVAVQLWIVLRLAGQNDQLLIRLKMIEADFRSGAGALPPRRSEGQSGLPPGDPAPAFTLDDLDAERVRLRDLLSPARPLLLLFVSPGCNACDALLPDVLTWREEHADRLDIAVISSGSVSANRDKAERAGLDRILLQKRREVEESYQIQGTPSAVIIRPDGTVGSPVAAGIDQVGALVEQIVALVPAALTLQGNADGRLRSVPDMAQFLSPPLEIPTPPLALEDLAGNTVRLDSLRGMRYMLIFYSTTCSWCAKLLPELQEWEMNRPAGAPRIALIATGEEEEMGRLGLRSPILPDLDGRAGAVFGVNGTPSAALIEPDGTFSRRVLGYEAIGALLRGDVDWPASGSIERSA